MLWALVEKETRGNIASLRFRLTFVLVVAAFILSGVLFISQDAADRVDDAEIQRANRSGLEQRAAQLRQIPYYVQTFARKPRTTRLWAEGGEKFLPNLFRSDVFSIEYPLLGSRTNFLLPRFASLDWTFIIAFILSFVALLIMSDSLSAERRRGTLGLMLSNAVPRSTVIWGKYLSGILTLSLSMSAGLAASLIVVAAGKVPLWGGDHGWRLAAYILLSFLYLSSYVWLGLLVSSRTTRPSSSIIILMSVWVVLTFLLPGVGRVASEKVVYVPSLDDLDRRESEATGEIWNHSDRFGPEAGGWADGKAVNPPARAALYNAITDARNRIREEYMARIIAQVRAGRRIARLSPAAVFQYAGELVSGTGVERFEDFYRQVNRYREELKAFILRKDGEDPQSLHLLCEGEIHSTMISSRPVPVSEIPRFEEQESPLARSGRVILRDALILIVLNVLLAALVILSFRRADVRPQ